MAKGFGPAGANGAQAAPKAEPVDDGGPAFPEFSNGGILGPTLQSGMTLRDYFAGQALAGPMVSYEEHTFDAAARVAYALADAMIAERKKAGGQ